MNPEQPNPVDIAAELAALRAEFALIRKAIAGDRDALLSLKPNTTK